MLIDKVYSQTLEIRHCQAEKADLESRITILLQQQAAQSKLVDDPLQKAFNSGSEKLNNFIYTDSAQHSTQGSVLLTQDETLYSVIRPTKASDSTKSQTSLNQRLNYLQGDTNAPHRLCMAKIPKPSKTAKTSRPVSPQLFASFEENAVTNQTF